MEIVGTETFPYAREHVWAKLMDFDVLGKTLPGIRSLEPIDEDSCTIDVKVLVPAITGSYKGTVRIVDKSPVDSYRLRGEAKGRLGWVKGDAFFELSGDGDETQVTSTMTIQTGGALSGVGQRFMQAVGNSMVKQFFAAFGEQLAV